MIEVALATGLRERKKQKTREEIARAAMKLFTKRGFDNVTVAEIAEAADVSEKTVFNYFPVKEDLFFSGGEARWAELLEEIREQPAGSSVVDPFRRATHRYLDLVANGDVDELTARPRLVMQSAALRARMFVWWEQEAALLAPAIAEAAGDTEGRIVPEVVARTLAWTHRSTFRAAFTRLLDGEDQKRVARDLRKQADETYDLLESGLRSYGKR
jgi:AcrR family transcriptional regulator